MTSPTTSASAGAPSRQHPTSAVVALVMGILGLVALPLVGSILAVVFGNQSRREAAARPELYTDDLGRVGRVLGWVGLALVLVGLLAILVVVAVFMPV